MNLPIMSSDAVDEWLDTPLFADDVLKALFKQVRNVGYDRFGVFEKVVLHRRFIQKIRYCIIGANMSNL